ncbi:MAG: ABC transporter permease [Clostridiales bacterium]|nr:ABC transporter permease [Clostridiales bacterium]
MKFFSLLKKEIRELLTPTAFIGMICTLILFVVIGEAFGGIMEEVVDEASTYVICDQDKSDFSTQLIKTLTIIPESTESGKIEDIKYDIDRVKLIDIESDDYQAELKKHDVSSVLIIPKGFGDKAQKGEEVEIHNITLMSSGSMLSNISANDAAIETFKAQVKSLFYVNNGLSTDNIVKGETIVQVKDTTVIKDKSADISSSVVSSLLSTQSLFVPIVIFVLIIYCSQLIIGAISTEKIDKTFETLLSAPVTRISILSSKMLAAATIAALNAVVYMIGFSRMMNGIMGSVDDGGASSKVLEELGLTLTTSSYFLLGLQMFLTILITLAVSLILGALAKDAKSAQTLMMPITFLSMVPYMLTMFVDIRTLPIIVRLVVYAIPFTHTFIASENILFGHMNVYWAGFAYQLVLLVICLTVAVKIFTSDKILTMTLSFDKKSKAGKKKLKLFGK